MRHILFASNYFLVDLIMYGVTFHEAFFYWKNVLKIIHQPLYGFMGTKGLKFSQKLMFWKEHSPDFDI